MRTVRFTVMAMLALVLSLGALSGVAAAGEADPDYPAQPKPTVLDDSVECACAPTSKARNSTEVLNSGVSLPVTGGDVVGLTILGLSLVGVGVAFTTYRRRADI